MAYLGIFILKWLVRHLFQHYRTGVSAYLEEAVFALPLTVTTVTDEGGKL
jgi:hypothetical protein